MKKKRIANAKRGKTTAGEIRKETNETYLRENFAANWLQIL